MGRNSYIIRNIQQDAKHKDNSGMKVLTFRHDNAYHHPAAKAVK
jgi:hypothetical protein